MIIDNITIPETAVQLEVQNSYPFNELEIGQGFKVTGDEKKLRSVASAYSRFKTLVAGCKTVDRYVDGDTLIFKRSA